MEVNFSFSVADVAIFFMFPESWFDVWDAEGRD